MTFPSGWWDKIPPEYKNLFDRKVLRQGYVYFIQGQVEWIGFFRNVYQIRMADDRDQKDQKGQKDHRDHRDQKNRSGIFCTYRYGSDFKKSEIIENAHCTCSIGKIVEPCSHLAGLFFKIFSLDATIPIGSDYKTSFWASLALGICRSENTLEINLPDQSFAPHLPVGWESNPSQKTNHFIPLAREEINPSEIQSIKQIGYTPTLRSEFGEVGEACRFAFLHTTKNFSSLKSKNFDRQLDWDAEKKVFRIIIQDSDSGLKGTGTLLCDPAFSLYKKFPEIRLGSGFSEGLEIWSKGLELKLNAAGEIKIRPFAKRNDLAGGKIFSSQEKMDFQFGDQIYLIGIGFRKVMAPAGVLFQKYLGWKEYTVLKASVPEFLEKYGSELNQTELYDIDPVLQNGSSPATVNHIEIEGFEKVGARYRIHFNFHLGSTEFSLQNIKAMIDAKQTNLITTSGFVDFDSHLWSWLNRIKTDAWDLETPFHLWLSLPFLMRICVQLKAEKISIQGKNLPQLLVLPSLVLPDLNSKAPAPAILGSISKDQDEMGSLPFQGLRPYQQDGLRWLAHLIHFGISGILADDMGLGKTHQVMSLIAWMHQRSKVQYKGQYKGQGKILIVCPTSVLYHWQEKLQTFHPELKSAIFFGPDRKIETLKENVIITSYGIVRRDIELLRTHAYSLLILDEIQNAKNRDSDTHRSFQEFPADSIIGLSGTPLENSPLEVKNLFDLLLPGYFPGESEFKKEILDPLLNPFGQPSDQGYARQRFVDLCRPFLFRRLKKDVLQDLPDKVEETYHCDLNPDQAVLYREAIVKKGKPLLESLRGPGPGNLMHIFQLLNLLKQICNHPLTIANSEKDGQNYSSGKWDLFTELLEQSLNAGHKIVVFSQYLGMLAWIENHLKKLFIGFNTLTGATRDRAKVLNKFREDENCRVFCCSLKAGGVGIDLTAASTVIHYDRWWNAAKENQATDRVHRIGQQKNVQVFKLVTRGTIEERIDAIIKRKADWMDTLLPEAGEESLKLFSKEELIELLSLDK